MQCNNVCKILEKIDKVEWDSHYPSRPKKIGNYILLLSHI